MLTEVAAALEEHGWWEKSREADSSGHPRWTALSAEPTGLGLQQAPETGGMTRLPAGSIEDASVAPQPDPVRLTHPCRNATGRPAPFYASRRPVP